MTINLHLPSQNETLRPTITVVGVGGAGGNAVNNMINSRLEGVEFVVANTDAQALENSLSDRKIQLGSSVTRGLGAGADPSIGRAAAEEALDEIIGYIQGSNMVFITAGMGGGTGTGAAPVVAKAAREQGILTVGVVTKPFQFEGTNRMRMAESGLEELQQYVDTLIVIPNQNLFRLATEKTTFADAFCMADEVLHSGVRGVTDLMVRPLQNQSSWLSSERGGTIPQDVMDSFEKLFKISQENNVSFEELCVYALGNASKDGAEGGDVTAS